MYWHWEWRASNPAFLKAKTPLKVLALVWQVLKFETWPLSLVHQMLNKGHSLCCLKYLHYLTDAPGKSLHTLCFSCPFPLPGVYFQSWSGKGFNFHSHAPCIDRLFQKKETKQKEQEFRQAAWNVRRCTLPDAKSITISITESNIFLHFRIITGLYISPAPPWFLNLFVGLYYFLGFFFASIHIFMQVRKDVLPPAAKLPTETGCRVHIRPGICKLHWLLIEWQTDVKTVWLLSLYI